MKVLIVLRDSVDEEAFVMWVLPGEHAWRARRLVEEFIEEDKDTWHLLEEDVWINTAPGSDWIEITEHPVT